MSDGDPPFVTLAHHVHRARWLVDQACGPTISKHADQAGYVALAPWVVTHVYTDACKSEGALTEIGPTVDDLVTSLADQGGSDATEPVDVEVGGYPAKLIKVSVPTDLDTSTCSNPGLLIQIWADATESG